MHMWTMEELLAQETPYLTMEDMTKEDWQELDFALEKYDRSESEYDLTQCSVLKFVLQQIRIDRSNFTKVPSFIRNGRRFQELAAKYNPTLVPILFPNRELTN